MPKKFKIRSITKKPEKGQENQPENTIVTRPNNATTQ
jgi:hypothetical protein